MFIPLPKYSYSRIHWTQSHVYLKNKLKTLKTENSLYSSPNKFIVKSIFSISLRFHHNNPVHGGFLNSITNSRIKSSSTLFTFNF